VTLAATNATPSTMSSPRGPMSSASPSVIAPDTSTRTRLPWSRQSPGRDLLTQPVEYIVAWLIQHGRALRRPGQVDPDAAYGAVMRGLDQDPA